MDTEPHPADRAVAEYSDLYDISLSDGIWRARLRGGDDELVALSFGQLRDLMLADPARRAADSGSL